LERVKKGYQKMKFRLTIKRMLTGLILAGVAAVLVLAVISLNSNNKLMTYQKQLTETVLPLDTAARSVKNASADFMVRNLAVRNAGQIDALEKLADRAPLEQAFALGIRQLKKFAAAAGPDKKLSGLIRQAEKIYQYALEKDTAIFEAARSILEAEAMIKKNKTVPDRTAEKLHKVLKPWSEKLGDASVQKKVQDLRLAVALLTHYGHQILLTDEPEKISDIQDEKIARTAESAETSLRALSELDLKEEDADILQSVQRDYLTLKAALGGDDGSLARIRTVQLEAEKNARNLYRELKDTADRLSACMEEIQETADSIRGRAEKEAAQINRTAVKIILIVVFGAIGFMSAAGWVIIRRIVAPINKAVSFSDTISRGDLTAEIEKENDDEIGNLVSKLGEMAHSLNSLIGQVQRSGIQVTSSATELAAVAKQQEAVMKAQLESTNYVVKSVGEISSVSEDLVETMQRVAAMSEQTAEFANSGQTDLSHMEEAMHHMENASKSISSKLEAINEKAANITSVVTTITKVADQTNLLSLNAAIEAEKAGEYGRGFTVVAREIRRLADQTAVATLDIDQMVQEMQSAVSAGVMEMDAFITEVQRSAENVGKISMQLSRIIEQVQGLSPSFEGVNESMQFQSGKAQQINNSMVNLSEEMRQTAESLRESFLAIEQLNDAAAGLQDEVSRFKVM
jgi:methyl-accepting chemotaxis protein WspA